jgi:hypothetical protein
MQTGDHASYLNQIGCNMRRLSEIVSLTPDWRAETVTSMNNDNKSGQTAALPVRQVQYEEVQNCLLVFRPGG